MIVWGETAKPSNCTIALHKGCLTKLLAEIAAMIHINVIRPKFIQFEAQDNPPVQGGGEDISRIVESSSKRTFGLQNFILP